MAAKQTDSAPVTKITIVPRTSGALGYTMQVDEGEHNLMSKDELLNKVATLTGGRAAEELIFGSITTGASNDIEQATKLTRSMITRYGMSRKFDMVALETVTNQYLSGDTALACSAETAAKIDEEVIATVKTAHEKAIGILQNNMDALHRLAHFLLEKKPSPAKNLWICCINPSKSVQRKPSLVMRKGFLPIPTTRNRPERERADTLVRLSIYNYIYLSDRISAGCSNLRSDVSFSASEHPHRARTLLTPALLAHCISYSLSPI